MPVLGDVPIRLKAEDVLQAQGRKAAPLRGLRRPTVAIGAPVSAYTPRVAEQLRTELVIPPHAEVASAVGRWLAT